MRGSSSTIVASHCYDYEDLHNNGQSVDRWLLIISDENLRRQRKRRDRRFRTSIVIESTFMVTVIDH